MRTRLVGFPDKRELSVAIAKSDCTGQLFGYLTVLGQAEIIKDKSGKSRQLWLLECVCGKKFKTCRGNFDRKGGGQKSCGCMKYKSGNLGVKPQKLSGKRFGNLVPIAIVPGLRISPTDHSKVWLCQCDCGRRVKKSTKRLNSGYSLHCGERNAFHIPYAKYPVAPKPYPSEAADLVAKYLHLTKEKYWHELQWGDTARERFDYSAETEDERVERLLRAAWIIVYRRRQGEIFGDLKEKRFIRKHLRYCQTDVYWRHKLEKTGGMAYDLLGKRKLLRK